VQLQTISAEDTDSLFDALSEDGALIVTGLFDKIIVDTISVDIEKALAGEPWCNTPDAEDRADFLGRKTKRLHGILQYSPFIEDCLLHPFLLSTAHKWLGYKPQFNTGEVMAIGPGEVRQALHFDAGSWHKADLPGELLFSINLALTDFTAENGATMVAPGSHKWSKDYRYSSADFAPAEMSKGSALIYAGSALHSGGANQTEQTRVGLYLGYVPFWLQAQENTVTSHPPGFLDTLKPETQALLTYRRNGFTSILG